MRSSQFVSSNRQDDLLLRLKQCVGDIKKIPSEQRQIQPNKLLQRSQGRQSLRQQPTMQRRLQQRQSYRHSVTTKQNQSDKKYYVREQDYRQSTGKKAYVVDENRSINQTKNYVDKLQQDQYRLFGTDRKTSLPLADIQNLSHLKKNLFTKQPQQRSFITAQRQVSDLTKNRIAERQSLIRDSTQSQNISNRRVDEKVSKQSLDDEDQFLQRLSLRKANYLHDRTSINGDSQSKRQLGGLSNQQSVQIKRRDKPEEFTRLDRFLKQTEKPRSNIQQTNQYSDNRSKFQSTYPQMTSKQVDYRKAEKVAKLKKITQMNQQINNRIKKIVDTFENYLTHRQY